MLFPARRSGSCHWGDRIEPGQRIKSLGKDRYAHEDCEAARTVLLPGAKPRAAYFTDGNGADKIGPKS